MKKLFKKLKSINRQIADCKKSVKNMEAWPNKTNDDIFDLKYEQSRLPRLEQRKVAIIQKIKEWADKELENYNDKAHADAA